LKPVRLNLFWKLGVAFFALLIAVLLPVDFYAERALRRDYERAGFDELAAVARIALAHPPSAAELAAHAPQIMPLFWIGLHRWPPVASALPSSLLTGWCWRIPV